MNGTNGKGEYNPSLLVPIDSMLDRAWETEVARETAAAQARNRVATRSVTATRHRVYVPQPLFLDDEDYDNYDYDDLGYEDEYDYYY